VTDDPKALPCALFSTLGHLHAGKVLSVTWEQQLEPAQLRATLTSSSFLTVRLEQDSEAAVPPELPALIVAALAGSAPELAVLHGLPLLAPQGHPEVTLAAFTRLRALTLRQTTESIGRLRAADLPASLVELTLCQDLLDQDDVDQLNPPLFIDELRSLQRITLDQYCTWHLRSTEGEQHSKGPVLLPASFRVRTGVHCVPNFACRQGLCHKRSCIRAKADHWYFIAHA